MARKKKKSSNYLIPATIIVAAVVIVGLFLAFVLLAGLTPHESRVAVVKIEGYIGGRDVNLDSTLKLLEQARDDPAIGAVVLDINSPGGLPVATREIGEKVKELKQRKPVVAWIGESGTSGGYWIATTSDWLMADPLSMVGSIGVILQVPNFSGLMEKLGIQVITITGGEYKDLGSPFRNMTIEERQMLEEISNQLHEEFIVEVANNRGLNMSTTRALADGQVYLGRRALELGLIDQLSTRDDAIKKAAEFAGIDPNWFYLQEEGFFLFDEIFPEQPFWIP